MRQRGFTITELMIVVAIMGTLTVAVAPSLARWSTSIHMSSSIREIASELQLARMKAIAQNTRMTVCFYSPSSDFPKFTHGFLSLHITSTGWCTAPPSSPGPVFNQFKATVRALPTGVSVEPSQSSFTFNSKGRAGAGNIAFTRLPIPTSKPPRPDKKIKVDSVGRVRICAPAADSTCL